MKIFISANECATLISLVAEKCQEYSWKTIGLLTSLQISIQNKSNSRVDLEKKIAQRVGFRSKSLVLTTNSGATSD